jgi:hypothetical protein
MVAGIVAADRSPKSVRCVMRQFKRSMAYNAPL